MKKQLISLLITLILFLKPFSAFADLVSYFGLNPRSMGLGGAYSAVSDDVAGLYYNPAGLIQLQGTTFSAGVLFGFPMFNENSISISPTEETSYYIHIGFPLAGALKKKFAFGFSLNMPWQQVLETKYYKKQEPYFVLYDNSVRLLQLRLGAALQIPYKPLSFLSIGAAIHVLGSVNGFIGFYAPYQTKGEDGKVPDPDKRLEVWADMKVPTATFVTVGAMAFLGKKWRVGVTYHSTQSITVKFPISFTTDLLQDYNILLPVDAEAWFKTKFHPQNVSFGLSYQGEKFLLTADVIWLDYSSYEIPYAYVTLELEKLQSLLPNAELLTVRKPEMEWKDIIVPRFGGEYKILSWLTFRAGYFYEKSPLEKTDFPIYDCDKHGITIGFRASFLKPWELIPGWLNFDLSFQDIFYSKRSILGADVGGHVFAISSGIEIIFM